MHAIRSMALASAISGLFISAGIPHVVHGQSVGGARGVGGVGAVRGGAVLGGRGASVGRGSSVVGDGMGGFSVYSGSRKSRYIDSPAAPGKVYHRNGTSSQVIEDGRGNLDVYGSRGTKKAFRSRGPAAEMAPEHR
jgi:hypothetical protein